MCVCVSVSILGVHACVCFGSECKTLQPELGSETGERDTREAAGDLL